MRGSRFQFSIDVAFFVLRPRPRNRFRLVQSQRPLGSFGYSVKLRIRSVRYVLKMLRCQPARRVN